MYSAILPWWCRCAGWPAPSPCCRHSSAGPALSGRRRLPLLDQGCLTPQGGETGRRDGGVRSRPAGSSGRPRGPTQRPGVPRAKRALLFAVSRLSPPTSARSLVNVSASESCALFTVGPLRPDNQRSVRLERLSCVYLPGHGWMGAVGG